MMNESDNFVIRKFKMTDLCELMHLVHNTIDTSYRDFYPPRAVEFFKQFHSEDKILNRSRLGTILVMEEGGKLVATGSMVDGIIFAVFVNPQLQKGGRGKALMRRLEIAAHDAGATESNLDISLPSRQFYESIGYVVTEEISRDLGEGQCLKFWQATKKFSPE